LILVSDLRITTSYFFEDESSWPGVNEYYGLSDHDDDGLKTYKELNEYGTNPINADTDEDGVNDGDEVNIYQTSPTSYTTEFIGPRDKYESTLTQYENNYYRKHQQSSIRNNFTKIYLDEFLMTYGTHVQYIDDQGILPYNSFQLRVDAAGIFDPDIDGYFSSSEGFYYDQYVVDSMMVEIQLFINDVKFNFNEYISNSRSIIMTQDNPNNGMNTVWFDALIQGLSIFDPTPVSDIYYSLQSCNSILGEYLNTGDVKTNSLLLDGGLKMGIDYGENFLGFSNGKYNLGVELSFDFLNLPLNSGDKLTFDIKYSVKPHLNTWVLTIPTSGTTYMDIFEYFEIFDIYYVP
jgi:hypothetical protein